MRLLFIPRLFVVLLSFYSVSGFSDTLEYTEEEAKEIILAARDEINKREDISWAENAHVRIDAFQDDALVITAWGPYTLNTLGDFRIIKISKNKKILTYKVGSQPLKKVQHPAFNSFINA